MPSPGKYLVLNDCKCDLIDLDNVASNTPPEGIEAITEGQAKVNYDIE